MNVTDPVRAGFPVEQNESVIVRESSKFSDTHSGAVCDRPQDSPRYVLETSKCTGTKLSHFRGEQSLLPEPAHFAK